jgi:hypothetical protein
MHQSIWFSSPTTQHKFDPFPFYVSNSNIPILHGCMSVLECAPYEKHLIGDHEIWYSKVLDIVPDGIKKQGEKYESLKPLLYYESSYRSIGDKVFIQAFETSQLDFAEWTHRAHLRMAWIYFQGLDSHAANEKIRHGIKQYNQANAQLIKHAYNETITSFFCHLVNLAIKKDQRDGMANSDFVEFLERYPYLDNFDFIYNFYTKELLYSENAKERYYNFT